MIPEVEDGEILAGKMESEEGKGEEYESVEDGGREDNSGDDDESKGTRRTKRRREI